MFRLPWTACAAIAGALALGLAAMSAGAEEPTAAGLFDKAIDNLTAQQGFHMKLDSEMAASKGVDPLVGGWEGWVLNPDVSFFKMVGGKGTEVVNKGEKSAYREGGRRAKWKLGMWSEDARRSDPMNYLRGFKQYSAGAEFLPEETFESIPCRIVQARPPADSVRGLLEGVGISEEDIDWPKSTLTLRLWVGKDDLLLRKAEADLDAVVLDPAGDSRKEPEKLRAKATFLIFKYNEEIGVDRLPEEVRELLALQ